MITGGVAPRAAQADTPTPNITIPTVMYKWRRGAVIRGRSPWVRDFRPVLSPIDSLKH